MAVAMNAVFINKILFWPGTYPVGKGLLRLSISNPNKGYHQVHHPSNVNRALDDIGNESDLNSFPPFLCFSDFCARVIYLQRQL